jgi:dTDP-4-dehydrorhamnose reductase
MNLPGCLLILGTNGMLGHMLLEVATARDFEVIGVCRRIPVGFETIFASKQIITGFDIRDLSKWQVLLQQRRPRVVINCIGVVKQSSDLHDEANTIWVNSLFPHRAAGICADLDIRFLHLSTDCVFSGEQGGYRECDPPDPVDFYGLSKWAGEPVNEGALTIRTSMIGSELGSRHGLLEWLLSQRGKTVQGFTGAIFSGLYTRALANILLDIAVSFPKLSGMRHLATAPISKYNLLTIIRDACQLDVQIEKDDTIHVDRSLDSSLLATETGIRAPSWEAMVRMLAEDLKGRQI